MWQSLAPYVDEPHQETLTEKSNCYYASDDEAAYCQEEQEPQEVRVSIPVEDLCLDLVESDEREVQVEDESEIELAHEEE